MILKSGNCMHLHEKMSSWMLLFALLNGGGEKRGTLKKKIHIYNKRIKICFVYIPVANFSIIINLTSYFLWKDAIDELPRFLNEECAFFKSVKAASYSASPE